MLPEPLTRPLSDGKNWLLEENIALALNDGRTIFTPNGFIFDYASIPRIAWRLFPPATGKHRIPALFHDWLCASGNVTWKDAADIFLEIMKKYGVNKLVRYSIYWSVRLFEPFHKPDIRQDRLRLLQRVELERCTEHYSNII